MNFEEAAGKVKELPKKPNDNEMLELYGLYKQSTVGNINTDRPGFWDLVGKAKWDSWKLFEGTSKDIAQKQYISLVQKLVKKYNNF